jgi:hypothetical protein
MNALQWIIFMSAWTFSYLAHAQNSVASASNGVRSIRHWFELNLWPVVVNLIATIALGLIWSEAPTVFSALVKSVPITIGTSLGLGLTIQSLVDRLMFMFGIRVEMPRLVPPDPNSAKKETL